jgi:hypothetical protein
VGALLWEKLDVSHMRVFGAWTFMHVPGALRHKLGPVCKNVWFIGYEADCAKTYRILREQDNRMIVSRDVNMDEWTKESEPRSEFQVQPGRRPGGEARVEWEADSDDSKPSGGNSKWEEGQEERWGSRRRHCRDQSNWGNREEGDGVKKRYSTEERSAIGEWYRANMAAEEKETEAQTCEEALAGPNAGLILEEGNGRGVCVAVGGQNKGAAR